MELRFHSVNPLGEWSSAFWNRASPAPIRAPLMTLQMQQLQREKCKDAMCSHSAVLKIFNVEEAFTAHSVTDWLHKHHAQSNRNISLEISLNILSIIFKWAGILVLFELGLFWHFVEVIQKCHLDSTKQVCHNLMNLIKFKANVMHTSFLILPSLDISGNINIFNHNYLLSFVLIWW